MTISPSSASTIPFEKKVTLVSNMNSSAIRPEWEVNLNEYHARIQNEVLDPKTVRNRVYANLFGHDQAADSKLYAAVQGAFLAGPIPETNNLLHGMGRWTWTRMGAALVEKVTMMSRSSGMYETAFGPPLAFWPPPIYDIGFNGLGHKKCSEWIGEVEVNEEVMVLIEANIAAVMGVLSIVVVRLPDEKGKIGKRLCIQVGGDESFEEKNVSARIGKDWKLRKWCTLCNSGAVLNQDHYLPDCPVLKRINGSRVKAGNKKLVLSSDDQYATVSWPLVQADLDIRAEIQGLKEKFEKLESRLSNVEKGGKNNNKRKGRDTEGQSPQKKAKGSGGQPVKKEGNSTGGDAKTAPNSEGSNGKKKGKGKGKKAKSQQPA